jgi:hypothetical protein
VIFSTDQGAREPGRAGVLRCQAALPLSHKHITNYFVSEIGYGVERRKQLWPEPQTPSVKDLWMAGEMYIRRRNLSEADGPYQSNL